MTEWIYQVPGFPDFLWNESDVYNALLVATNAQSYFFGRLYDLGLGIKEESSLLVLSEDVLQTSAIEGVDLDASSVRSSIVRRLGMSSVSESRTPSDEQEGIVAIVLDAKTHYDEPITEARLFRWHANLFSQFDMLNPVLSGGWRQEQMHIVSGAYGRQRVHYEAPSVETVPEHMNRFLSWVEGDGKQHHPVVQAGIAHLWFEIIHPFEDGNGRIGRAVSDALLARADKDYSRFYSMSAEMWHQRKEYYKALEASQGGDNLDITEWLLWYINCLEKSIRRAELQLKTVLFKAQVYSRLPNNVLNDRQLLILNRMLSDSFRGHINSKKYATLTKCSVETAIRDIRGMVRRGVLIQNEGSGKNTSYRVTNDLRTIETKQ